MFSRPKWSAIGLMQLRGDENPRDRGHLDLVAHCRGELVVGIKILDSILWINGTVKKKGKCSASTKK